MDSRQLTTRHLIQCKKSQLFGLTDSRIQLQKFGLVSNEIILKTETLTIWSSYSSCRMFVNAFYFISIVAFRWKCVSASLGVLAPITIEAQVYPFVIDVSTTAFHKLSKFSKSLCRILSKLYFIVVKVQIANPFERTSFNFTHLLLTSAAPVVSAKYIKLDTVLLHRTCHKLSKVKHQPDFSIVLNNFPKPWCSLQTQTWTFYRHGHLHQ